MQCCWRSNAPKRLLHVRTDMVVMVLLSPLFWKASQCCNSRLSQKVLKMDKMESRVMPRSGETAAGIGSSWTGNQNALGVCVSLRGTRLHNTALLNQPFSNQHEDLIRRRSSLEDFMSWTKPFRAHPIVTEDKPYETDFIRATSRGMFSSSKTHHGIHALYSHQQYIATYRAASLPFCGLL